MPDPIGALRWAIADGYIPAWSNGPRPEFLSHEALNILNAGDADAHITLTIFYADREPAGPYHLTVPARRTLHQRVNELDDPEVVPLGKGYSALLEADVPVVVQHTRLDSRQAENGLFSTLAWSGSA